MIDSTSERDPVEMLADEFASRYRNGEFPSVAEYATKYPEYAGRIETLFPTVAMMEQLRTEEKSKRAAAARRAGFGGPPDHIGDFDIIREIGRGGMGIVYEAEQRSLARRVAVKVLPKHVLLLDKHLKRFQREAQTAAKLRHTNIVSVFGVGEQDGLHYYVMPLIRGIGLDEIIRELCRADTSDRDIKRVVPALVADKFPTTESAAGNVGEATSSFNRKPEACASPRARLRLAVKRSQSGVCSIGVPAGNWRTVAHFGIQAAEALDHAHVQGTLHRDIKPGNLLVDADGVVCVADFGLARAVDHSDVSRSGEVVGTLRYMAPEQMRGDADARSDIYALGLTLYELLTLQPAFDDTDLRRCQNGQPIRREPVQPRKMNRTIPRDLETIILKCLAPEPSKRYQTAAALAADLRRLLADRPIRARRASSIERVWRWCRRNPALAAMSALAAILLIAVAATVVTGSIRTRRAYDEASGAYADAKKSLNRAEATSQLAMEVLDDIYLQLSPDRDRISSDGSPIGEDEVKLSLDRASTQWQVSNETALLLENLLVFYDRLAEQTPSDSQVMLESAIASRRVGDIRQRLGQMDQAEREYARAVEKLKALIEWPDADIAILTQLARTHNEIGNVRSARLEHRRAYESHVQSFSILQSVEPADGSADQYRHELARTLYFLAGKRLGGFASRRGDQTNGDATGSGPHHYKSNEYRERAIGILEDLTREHPGVADYRFLLALCHRLSGIGPAPCRSTSAVRSRQQAIQILTELKAQHPNVTDYRYELSATYAAVHVGLYSWESCSEIPPETEHDLLKALVELRWLVTHSPTIPEYARSQTVVLAKLGTVCWENDRLRDTEDFFQKAFEKQSTVVTNFPDLPSHNRVLLEFVRLRLGQVRFQRDIDSQDPGASSEARKLLETSIDNLTELTKRPELAEDRLAWSSLQCAYEVLGPEYAKASQKEKAEEAQKTGEEIRNRMSGTRKRQRRRRAPPSI
ncbi:MAG: serine/threonine protein kinase [Planctomycetes bacterium]|nr:serine/threonine protein kinase [Planctomycetota bacterium]MBL7039533.1 serine/threonine protein kinase [Pirellulaceae bacterium]